MKDFKAIWKTLADEKSITSVAVIQYCILRAITAKCQDKIAVATGLIAKSFTPVRNKNKLRDNYNNDPYYNPAAAMHAATFRKNYIFGVKITEILDTPEEIDMYRNILAGLKDVFKSGLDRVYSYIFVRGNLSSEQQMVQSAHVTMVIGQEMDRRFNANRVYYQIVRWPDEVCFDDLVAYHPEAKFEKFVEPDMGYIITAVGTHPIPFYKRERFMKYNLVTFNKELV